MKFRDPSNPMWIQALKMLEQADQLHKHFFQLVKPKPSGPVWEPPADILETDRQFLILIDCPEWTLPGLRSSLTRMPCILWANGRS